MADSKERIIYFKADSLLYTQFKAVCTVNREQVKDSFAKHMKRVVDESGLFGEEKS